MHKSFYDHNDYPIRMYEDLLDRVRTGADRGRALPAAVEAGTRDDRSGAGRQSAEDGDSVGGSDGSIIDLLCSVALQVEKDHSIVTALEAFRRDASERDSRTKETMDRLSARLAAAESRLDAIGKAVTTRERKVDPENEGSRQDAEGRQFAARVEHASHHSDGVAGQGPRRSRKRVGTVTSPSGRPRSRAVALMERLNELLKQVERHESLFNLSGKLFGMTQTTQACLDRCRAIERILNDDISGLRILDAGCGLGYTSFYFANRGASVTGIDTNPIHIEACKLIGKLNGIPTRFKTQAFDLDYIERLEIADYDVAMLLDRLLQTTVEDGLDGTNELIPALLAKVPLVIVGAPSGGEAVHRDKVTESSMNGLMTLVESESVRILQLGGFLRSVSGRPYSLYAVSARSP